MNFKVRFFMNNIQTLLITVLITALAGTVYLCFYQVPTPKSVDVVLVRGGEVLYKSRPFSDADVAEMQMNLKMDNPVFTVNGFSYALMQDTVPLGRQGAFRRRRGGAVCKAYSLNAYFVHQHIFSHCAFYLRRFCGVLYPLQPGLSAPK